MTARIKRLMGRSDEFRAMWLDLYSGKGYIAERLKCSVKEVEEVRRLLGLPDKTCPSHLPAWEPTTEEIEERREEFQAGWPARCRRSRETSASRKAAGLKEYSFCRRTMSFQ
jgi:hypothetical protein